jgi:hypothetical protein
VDQIQEVIERYDMVQGNMTKDAKEWVTKFSNEEFMRKFVKSSELNKIF